MNFRFAMLAWISKTKNKSASDNGDMKYAKQKQLHNSGVIL